MSFRSYVALVSVTALFLFTPMWEGACVFLAIFVLFGLPAAILDHRRWRKSQRGAKKSLSFGIPSMETQKQNFRAINFVFAKSALLQRFFKRMSIAFDGISAVINQSRTSGCSFSRSAASSHHPSSAAGVYVKDPLYSHMSCNIYHRD